MMISRANIPNFVASRNQPRKFSEGGSALGDDDDYVEDHEDNYEDLLGDLLGDYQGNSTMLDDEYEDLLGDHQGNSTMLDDEYEDEGGDDSGLHLSANDRSVPSASAPSQYGGEAVSKLYESIQEPTPKENKAKTFLDSFEMASAPNALARAQIEARKDKEHKRNRENIADARAALAQKIQLASALDNSKRAAWQFKMNYEQKDRQIDAINKLKAAKLQGQGSLPIDPKTGQPFESKQAYHEHLKRERMLDVKDEIFAHDYQKKHGEMTHKILKQLDSINRVENSLDKLYPKGGNGKISKMGLALQSWYDSDAASLKKDLGEMAMTEEVAEVGSRTTNALTELYQEIKPGVDEPIETIKHKLGLRKQISNMVLHAPEEIRKLRMQGMRFAEAKELVDAKMAKEITAFTNQAKQNNKKNAADEQLAAEEMRKQLITYLRDAG